MVHAVLDLFGASGVMRASQTLLRLRIGSALISAAGVACAQPAATPLPVGPQSLVLLVASGDAHSELVARLYQSLHGLRDTQLLRVPVDTRSPSMDAAAFAALKAEVDARVPAQAQALLVTWTQPSRVQGSCAMGITSALSFGYAPRWCGQCAATEASPYYDSPSRSPWSDHQMRPAMMLGATNLMQAQALIERGVASRGAQRRPAAAVAQGWLVRTTDIQRSVRFLDFVPLAATGTPGVAWHYVNNASGKLSNAVSAQRDLMFYFTGLAKVPLIDTNRYLPGAVADHLTSTGGVLPDGGGQMPATAWLAAGLTGSYGTVEEPCNHVAKFPKASVLARHYAAGETLIEAYWKSVRWPGQGLFVGDPLARPWAQD